MAKRSGFISALGHSAFGNVNKGIAPPQSDLPSGPRTPIQYGAGPNTPNGGMTDYIDGIQIPGHTNLHPEQFSRVINEGGSGQ